MGTRGGRCVGRGFGRLRHWILATALGALSLAACDDEAGGGTPQGDADSTAEAGSDAAEDAPDDPVAETPDEADVPAPDLAPDGPETDGEAEVVVTDEEGDAIAGAPVVAHDATGAAIGFVLTDAEGHADIGVVDGGMISVFTADPEGTWMTVVAAVAPLETYAIVLNDPSDGSMAVEITVPPFAGASFYDAWLGDCYVSSGQTTFELGLGGLCEPPGDTATVIVRAMAGEDVLASGFAELEYEPGAAREVDITWDTDVTSHSLEMINAPTDVAFISASQFLVLNGLVAPFFPYEPTEFPATITVDLFDHPGSWGWRAQTSLDIHTASESFNLIGPELPETAQVDLTADLLPHLADIEATSGELDFGTTGAALEADGCEVLTLFDQPGDVGPETREVVFRIPADGTPTPFPSFDRVGLPEVATSLRFASVYEVLCFDASWTGVTDFRQGGSPGFDEEPEAPAVLRVTRLRNL